MDNLNENVLKDKMAGLNQKADEEAIEIYNKAKEDYAGLNKKNSEYEGMLNISKGQLDNHIDRNFDDLENNNDKYDDIIDWSDGPNGPDAPMSLGASYQVPVHGNDGRISYKVGQMPSSSGPSNPDDSNIIYHFENDKDNFNYGGEGNQNKPKQL